MAEETKSPAAPITGSSTPSSAGGNIQPQQSPDATQEQFTAAVDELLDQLQHKFDSVSREMFAKFDDMARRLDELEASLTLSGDTTTATTPTTATATAPTATTAATPTK